MADDKDSELSSLDTSITVPSDSAESTHTIPSYPTSSIEGFLDKITHLTDHEKVISIRQTQLAMLKDFEVANSKLASLNEISETTFNNSVAEFKQYTKMLHDMKKQLDSIFRRIRTLKVKAAIAYPDAYRLAEEQSTIRMERELSPDD